MLQGSLTIEELTCSLKNGKDQPSVAAPIKKLERVVFIDSTWSQSYGISTVRKLGHDKL